MTSKPESIIKQIEELPAIYSKPILQFKDWLIDEEDSSFANAGNYLRVLNLFCKDLKTRELKEVTKEDVLEFLDKRKNQLMSTRRKNGLELGMITLQDWWDFIDGFTTMKFLKTGKTGKLLNPLGA